ncbi:MAG: RNA-directed DNA polymerase [Gemmataceae bacterium]|nr:RNA-directed DNA polymerase [Gemmataceae bacterium]
MNWFRRLLNWLAGEPPADAPPAGVSSRAETGIQATPAAPRRSSSDAIQAGRPQGASPRPGPTLQLGAADFLPIPRDEMVDEAKAVGRALWSNPWFGRRDLIPPADDRRTALIDKGMVGEGLLTPKELVEIHETGAEMEKHRRTLEHVQHQAAMAGEAAVEADKARRAAIKEQKKKEAAEKNRRRAEAVAQRRATDIVFVGRGVSSRMHERTSDAAKLAALGLPVLHAPADVAAALGLTIPRLRWLAFHTEVAGRIHYVRFTVPKKSGGTRTLSAPHRTLAQAQRWIFNNILKRLPVDESAHGFVAGRSILSNARPHAGRAVLVNLDLADFFPSVHFPRVHSVFARLGYSGAAATLLALLCTECPRREVRYDGKTYFVATGPRGLPQGACTSPALANQVARRLDRRLAGLAKKMNLAYTRYADDLTLSSAELINERIGYLMARVRHIAQDEGFTVNEKKSRVLRKNAAQIVTGLVVNDKPTLRRKEIRRIRAILHRAAKEGLDRQNRTGHPHFVAQLRGKIALLNMVRPELAAEFSAALEQLVRA